MVYCFECNIPSKDKFIKVLLYSVFLKLMMEKSLSTVNIPGNTVTRPLQNSFSFVNLPVSMHFHRSEKDILFFKSIMFLLRISSDLYGAIRFLCCSCSISNSFALYIAKYLCNCCVTISLNSWLLNFRMILGWF